MTLIIDFLNQPIVAGLLTLVVGSYLLNLIADRRSRKNKLRDQAIEFLTEMGDDINSVSSLIYGRLKGHNSVSDMELVEAFTKLYSNRMSVEIGSKAYLNSEELPQSYDRLIRELEGVALYMTGDREQASPQQIISQIQERRNLLGKAWPIEKEMQQKPANEPGDELMLWMDMILHRTTHLLSNNLRSVI
jgi:hypothetical protein